MPTKENYKRLLKQIYTKLASGQMSLLVGSGLSKNVSTKFPSWDELLADLVEDLYKHDFESAYDNYLALQPSDPKEKELFIKTECQHRIEQLGHLEVVSEYIKRKQISESIATYIEEHVPEVYQKGDDYILDRNGVKEKIPEERFVLHRGLISLPWNNIYTTNYDNLLDICVDSGRYDRLKEEIDKLEKDIIKLEDEISDYEDSRIKADSGSINENELEIHPESVISNLKPTGKPSKERTVVSQSENQGKKPSFNIEDAKHLLSQKEKLKESKEIELNRCYRVVNSASELSVKNRKNVIKLHGSLRSKIEREKFHYEFDGDHKRQYIISKEDYGNYPTTHEAFTQLMRISLLQESFCLIGFSGSDPNFIQWIGWVRDILYKAARQSGNGTSDYKIYLLDVDEGNVPVDRQLFYRNHHIVRIPLCDPVLINILKGNQAIELDERKECSILKAFVAYLKKDEGFKSDIPTENILIREQYHHLWEKLPRIDNKNKPAEKEILSIANKIRKKRSQIWLPVPKFNGFFKQKSLIEYVNKSDEDHTFLLQSPALCKLTIAALKDYCVPITNILEDEVLLILQDKNARNPDLQKLIRRNDALSVNWKANLPSEQEQALRLAFSLRLKELHDYLTNWTATGRNLIFKSGFLALFDRKEAKKLLLKAVNDHSFDEKEEFIYILEMLGYLSFMEQNDRTAYRLYMAYSRAGYNGMTENLEFFEKQLTGRKEKIEPYGSGRTRITRKIELGNNSSIILSLQFLMYLAESGFQLHIYHTNFIPSEDWYKIMKAGFEVYPWPYLFYSLQYSNTDLMKRIGQDYIFSEDDNIRGQLNDICKALFKNLYENSYPELVNNITILLSTMIIGVRPDVWQSDFMEWWRSLINNGLAFDEKYNSNQNLLINEAFHYIDDEEMISEIMFDCLTDVSKGGKGEGVNKFYYLTRNRHYKNLSSDKSFSKPVPALIDKIISSLSTKSIDRLFLLGYLSHILSEKQHIAIKKQLPKLDYDRVDNARVWRVLLYFAVGQNRLQVQLRKAIANHELLWYTGIDDKGIHGFGNDFIPISLISFSDFQKNGLRWNKAQVRQIFRRLKESLAKIRKVRPGMADSLFSFSSILEEMVDFLTMYNSELSGEPSFLEILKVATEERNYKRKFNDLDEGLSSSDALVVLAALRELDSMVYLNAFNPEDFVLVLNRILLQAEPGVESSLGYMTIWLYYKDRGDSFRNQQSLLLQILKKYDSQPLEGADRAFVEEKIIRIACKLKEWDIRDPIIDAWLENGTNSKFNNIRQFMSKVDGDVGG